MKHTSKLLALLAVALLLPSGACNDPLHVSIPTIVPPGSLSDSAALGTLRAGAIGDFSIAFSGDAPDGDGGTGEGVIMYGGLLADEWLNSETFPTRIEVDARTIQVTNADVDLWYRLLHQARNSAEKTAAQYAAQLPNDGGHAEMLNLAGYTYLFFAETFCSGVPVSHLDAATGTITYGVPLTSRQLIDTAIGRFNEALTVSATVTNATLKQAMINLASVGKARALVDSGDFVGAAAAVSGVPTSFAYLSEHSEISTFENNGVFNGNTFNRRYSVADREGINGFPFRSVFDPRTTWRRRLTASGKPGFGFDGLTPQYNNFRFGDRKAPIPLATGVEARLIEAEAALQADTANPSAAFFTALNDPRANPASRSYFNPNPFSRTDTVTNPIPVLANLTAANDTAAGGAVNLLFAERARWLWLTAHRLGDLRRLIRQYGRAANTVFPTGPYPKTTSFGAYGTDVNIPVPVTEQNNPNFSACLDRLP
jgi:starch-binding outer membrane protein, SusD/RagB family